MVSTNRRLGRSEVQVSPVILGAMSLPLDRMSRPEAERTVHAALDHGITTIDTAPLYGYGACEEVLGSLIRDRREQVCLITKVGVRWDNDELARSGHVPAGRVHFSERDESGRPRVVRRDSRPESVRREVEACLRRLQVDTLDLVQVHFRDLETSVADTVGVLGEMLREGKLRAVGISNFSASEMLAAHSCLGELGLASHQLEYNLAERDRARALLPSALKLGIGVLAYSPLMRGVLTGRSEKLENITGTRTRRVLKRGLISLQEIAATRSEKPSTIALAWLLRQTGVTAVVCGARSPGQIADNSRAMDLALTDEEDTRLRRAFAGCDGSADWTLRLRARRLVRRCREVLPL
jgi:aryl-alcohol dehydrogenase-like predicted oxidoreductase